MNIKKKSFRFLFLLLIISILFIKMPSENSIKIYSAGKATSHESTIRSAAPADDLSVAYRRFDISDNIRFVSIPYYSFKGFEVLSIILSKSKVRNKPIFLQLDLRSMIIQKINSHFFGSKYKDIASFLA